MKGIFHKETVEKWIITNLRATKRFPVTKERPNPDFGAVAYELFLASCQA